MQLQKSGVLRPEEYLDYDKEQGFLNDEEIEEDFEIEMVHRGRAFPEASACCPGSWVRI